MIEIKLTCENCGTPLKLINKSNCLEVEFTVKPCSKCNENAYDEGYDDGYDQCLRKYNIEV